MNNDFINKIIQKRVLLAEIKLKENEFNMVQKQIIELEKSKERILKEVGDKLQEIQDIAEHLDGLEYEAMKKIS